MRRKDECTCLCCFLPPHWDSLKQLRFTQATVKTTIIHNNFPHCHVSFSPIVRQHISKQLWIESTWRVSLNSASKRIFVHHLVYKWLFSFTFIVLQIKGISIWKVEHQNSFWNRGKTHLGNGFFIYPSKSKGRLLLPCNNLLRTTFQSHAKSYLFGMLLWHISLAYPKHGFYFSKS